MKKYIIPSIFSLAIVFGASAQNDKDLKGPAYKNRKPWKDPRPATTLVVKDGESIKGAGAKLLTPFERKSGDTSTVELIANTDKLKGPAYKNRKVWEKSSTKTEEIEDLVAEQR